MSRFDYISCRADGLGARSSGEPEFRARALFTCSTYSGEMVYRMKRRGMTSIGMVAAIILSIFLFSGQSQASPISSAVQRSVVPLHQITCTYTAKVPSVVAGKYIAYGVKWTCNDYVDIRAVTIKLWRYSAATGYKNVASASGTNTSPNFQFYATTACSGANAGSYYYHSYYYVEAFHGNWGTNEGNSASQLITCP